MPPAPLLALALDLQREVGPGHHDHLPRGDGFFILRDFPPRDDPIPDADGTGRDRNRFLQRDLAGGDVQVSRPVVERDDDDAARRGLNRQLFTGRVNGDHFAAHARRRDVRVGLRHTRSGVGLPPAGDAAEGVR
jgi:hypothetical protein